MYCGPHQSLDSENSCATTTHDVPIASGTMHTDTSLLLVRTKPQQIDETQKQPINNDIVNVNAASNSLDHESAKPTAEPKPIRPWYVFTASDKALLRHSWQPVISHLENFGVEIYEMIFEQCPEARALFPFMENLDVEKARKKYSTEFSFQALRFVQILESGINALDDLSSLDLLLHNLGRRHGKLDATNIFRTHYWSVFLECAIHKLRAYISRTRTLTDAADVDRVIVLWRRLLEGIIERMEAGFKVDLTNRASNIRQRGGVIPKWKYSDSTRAGWFTASTLKGGTENLFQSFLPFRSKFRAKNRDILKN